MKLKRILLSIIIIFVLLNPALGVQLLNNASSCNSDMAGIQIRTIENAILFESITDKTPSRSIIEINKIISETDTDLILRAIPRRHYINDDDFDDLRKTIYILRNKHPNLLIIGNLFAQFVNYEEIDDITAETYTKEKTYNLMAFDPVKFGIISPNKYDFQTKYQKIYIPMKRWWPDITSVEFQSLFLHQAKRLIDAGVDGIWIDNLGWQIDWINGMDNNNPNIQKSKNAIVNLLDEIKKMKTIRCNTPLLGTWYRDGYIYKFDFLTKSITINEIKTIAPNSSLWDNKYNVPIIAYIDWGFGNTPLWYFSQNYTDTKQRKEFEIEILKTFTKFFKEKNIIWAYPVHGGIMCWEKEGAICNVLPFKGLWYNYIPTLKVALYDSMAPEFDTYTTIVSLMKRNKIYEESCIYKNSSIGMWYDKYRINVYQNDMPQINVNK